MSLMESVVSLRSRAATSSLIVVVGHQAICMHLRTGFLTGFREGLDEILPVHIIQKYAFAAIPAAHQVIHRTRVLNAQLPRHAAGYRSDRRLSTVEKRTKLG